MAHSGIHHRRCRRYPCSYVSSLRSLTIYGWQDHRLCRRLCQFRCGASIYFLPVSPCARRGTLAPYRPHTLGQRDLLWQDRHGERRPLLYRISRPLEYGSLLSDICFRLTTHCQCLIDRIFRRGTLCPAQVHLPLPGTTLAAGILHHSRTIFYPDVHHRVSLSRAQPVPIRAVHHRMYILCYPDLPRAVGPSTKKIKRSWRSPCSLQKKRLQTFGSGHPLYYEDYLLIQPSSYSISPFHSELL